MKINGIEITDSNLEDFYEFKEEEPLGRTDITCGACNGKGCYECDGVGDINDDSEHHCMDYEINDIDFDDDIHASIDRYCPICHMWTRLHFWRKPT